MSARMRLFRIMSKQSGERFKPKDAPAFRKKWNIVTGDKVQVIDRAHRDFGKQGVVMKVLRKVDRLLIEGINMGPKNIKGNSERGIKGRTIQVERPVPYCAANLVDPVTNKPTRVFRKILEDGTKVRVAKKSGAVIPRPDILTLRKRPVNAIVTESCTSEEDAWSVSYVPK